ncbi:hypothetical protein ACWC09_27585 [Streptomyces sp. NPDC001617]
MKADIHAAQRVPSADDDAATRCSREPGQRLDDLSVVQADNGCSALATLRDAALDAVVSDLVGPFALRLRSSLRRRPAAATDRVCATGLVMNPARREAVLGGGR